MSVETAEKVTSTIKVTSDGHHRKLLGSNEPKYTAEEIHSMQLPVSRLFVPNIEIDSTHPELCTFCEYFLHFVQETISSPANEVIFFVVVMQRKNSLYNFIVLGIHKASR